MSHASPTLVAPTNESSQTYSYIVMVRKRLCNKCCCTNEWVCINQSCCISAKSWCANVCATSIVAQTNDLCINKSGCINKSVISHVELHHTFCCTNAWVTNAWVRTRIQMRRDMSQIYELCAHTKKICVAYEWEMPHRQQSSRSAWWVMSHGYLCVHRYTHTHIHTYIHACIHA